jgi:hypothetical protein
MSSTGVLQGCGGAGESTSSILKSPLGSGQTAPEWWATFPQKSVVSTGSSLVVPILPPARIRAFSSDLDFRVRLHAEIKVTNNPRLSGGDDTKDKISSKRRGVASHRNNPNPALESHERISAHDG